MSVNLLLSLVVFLLIGLCGLMTTLHHRTQTKWMRILCATRDIPTHIMEGDEPPVTPEIASPPPVDTRKRISVPLPGANLFREKSSPFKVTQ